MLNSLLLKLVKLTICCSYLRSTDTKISFQREVEFCSYSIPPLLQYSLYLKSAKLKLASLFCFFPGARCLVVLQKKNRNIYCREDLKFIKGLKAKI